MKWLQVMNLADEGEDRRAQLRIEGVIGGFDFFDDSGQTASEFMRTVDALGDLSAIDIDLNSPGGVVSDGVAIANYLIQHPASVSVNVIGQAASIASVILQAADPGKRHMALGTTTFVHDPLTIAIGDADDFRDIAGHLDKIKGAIVELFTRHGTLDQEEAREMMRADITLTAQESIDAGIADTMDETLRAVACADLSRVLARAKRESVIMQEAQNTRKTYSGPQLASRLNDAIDAIDEDEGDERSRADVIDEMASEAGISTGTVNQILNADIDCPPLERLEGFANVSGLPSLSAQREAAESDGCEYGDDSDRNCATCSAKAETIVSLCSEANVPQLANPLIQSQATLAAVRSRIHDARGLRDACAAAGVPHLADKAIDAVATQRFTDFVRSALTELTAGDPDREISHHQPPGDSRPKAAINAVDFYRNR